MDSFWEGIDYDQGLKTNSEILYSTEYGTVHDGPIINCRQHPKDLDMFLSIGGKIFAIWDTRKKQVCHKKCNRKNTVYPYFIIRVYDKLATQHHRICNERFLLKYINKKIGL